MKTSLQPTEYLLIKAMTDSEWDDCGFAIIRISEEWKMTQKKRLEAVKAVENDQDLKWLNYNDTDVEFFRFSDQYPEMEELLSERNRIFIELETDDLKKLLQPENNLNCYQMQVFKNGNAIYNAFGKHTGDEFYTEEFSLWELT
ncbi:hypothetical protein SAMN05421856_11027 [Chryseobacterium taichungense]|uniref:Uncharacterized protein n=1 Tax=Chryseobacterium taichungense TaxID=295069 RepID=A0A1H8CMS8_9FLAO|nr:MULTISPECIES: hypothetical protein [Chryseobacterium]MCT4319254.1 hypothetical protein [Elizabethkingia anophelis]MEB4760231.1 hypothetical protein [Chryseobacterium indologenes]UMQ40552.1 hypothetical protein MKS83_14225 [Chryseobacterium sp. Y16C]SEM96571.1 hypothetical protein SAMN05421856_11027 [Chryseobacterium taichungense]